MNEKYNEQLLEAIRKNDRRVLQKFYNKYRESFLGWSHKNFGLTKEEGQEYYQRAFMVLYSKVISGKLEKLTSKPLTYLCSVGKNMYNQQLRKAHVQNHILLRLTEEEEGNEAAATIDNEAEEEEEQHQRNKELVRHLLNKIGDPCATLLRLLFVEGATAEEVAMVMNYSDQRVVRKRKSLCLKRLRELVQAGANSSQDTE